MANPNQTRRTSAFAQAVIYTIVAVAILGIANYLANRYNQTFDSTANKRYSLSDQSAKLARDLKEDLTLTYWDRPAAFPNARGLFDRYANLSPRIKVVYKDIDKNRLEAIQAKIEALGTIQVQVGNKTELAKSLTEEEVTGAMVRVLKGGDRTVCFTGGYGESDAANPEANGYSGVKQVTTDANYITKPVGLVPTPDIPKDCTILIIGGPTRNYLQAAVDAMRAYVEGGGRALFLLDPPLKFGTQVDDNDALLALLESWGVKANKDLVLDLSGQVRAGPDFVAVTSFSQHPIVRDFNGRLAAGFPLARSITTTSPDMTPLFGTQNAVEITDLTNPGVDLRAGKQGPRDLAAAGTVKNGATETRIVVVGNSRWISNEALEFIGNRDLYLNILAWLGQDEELISIRPKDPEDRRLNMNARQVTLLFWGSVIGLPVLFMVAGIAVYWRRR